MRKLNIEQQEQIFSEINIGLQRSNQKALLLLLNAAFRD
jgi:hypothetical protein